MTHSAVSQQIRQLEQWFDCPLFERRAGGVQLTAAGLDLQRAAEDAFDLLERRCDALRRSTQPSELAVGAPASFLSNWLIPGWSVSRPRIPTSASACRPRRTPPC